jgi:eukaryotic-like serine/threonine-protein kinase
MIAPAKWERVRALFHEALEWPPEARDQFVRRESDGDEELCREAQSLLTAHGDADGFLSSLPVASNHWPVRVMSLAVGSRVGTFEILELLGSGGMGEVYRARDTRLDRLVAIKVLSADVANNLRGRERLNREARLLSKASHPHICTLYDVGSVAVAGSELRFLVMELLEGETLAAVLPRGPMAIAQALIVATEIVDALGAAHALGIVHRDLKPANIMLTKTGVKLLDFGLARLRPPTLPADDEAVALRDPVTTEGALVGTLPYMAPEQLRGEAADARSDLFALGAVLYEMITGARAFAADSQAAVIAAILEREPPPLAAHQPLASPALERVVSACLAKNPDERWQTARDLRRELAWVRDADVATESAAPASVKRSSRRLRLWAAAIAAIVAAAVASVLMYSSRRTPPAAAQAITFSIYPPVGTTFPRGTAEMAVSPDGSRLVFVALSVDGVSRLWIRRLDAIVARAVEGTEGARRPFWAPDGRSIGFFAQGKVKRIAEGGGSPQVLCEATFATGGSWNREGTILFADGVGPLKRVSDTGGASSSVTTLDTSRHERLHAWPVFLADGRRFLYLARSSDREQTGIYQGSLDSSRTQRLFASDANVAVAGSQLFSLNNHSLIAQAYDPTGAQLVGTPTTVAERIALDSPLRSGGAFAAGAAGVVAYRSASPDSHLVWVDRTGTEVGTFATSADYHNPWLSPDQKRIAVEKTDGVTGRHTIWVLDLSRGSTSRLVFDTAGAHGPAFSPDGRRVAFASNRLGGVDLYSIRADGTGPDDLLLRSPERASLILNDWSSDQRLLLYQSNPRGQQDLWTLPVFPTLEPQPFLQTVANERHGQFSPDVRWIAYSSDESGVPEIYVRRFPDAGGKWQVSTHGGAQPRWRRDGKELFYLAPDGKLMAAVVTASASTFETDSARALFDTRIRTSFIDRTNHYVVTHDGQRFLVNISAEDENSAPITVVVNWQAAATK